MLGTLRFTLATLVVFNHVWLLTANKIGLHAVAGFFVVSGYLMTLVIAEVYKGPDGFVRYLANRFLRIFPLYWLVLMLTLAGLLAVPGVFDNLYSLIAWPDNAGLWLRNATLIDLIQSPVILVPPAWSLTIECAFYVLIGLGLGRWRWMAVAWFVLSLLYVGWLIYIGAPFRDRYSTVLAGSLFFSTGAVLYYFRSLFSSFTLRLFPWWTALALFCAFPLIVEFIGADKRLIGYYGATLIFLPIFISALSMKPHRLDGWLGDLAYPMFLVHFLSVGLVRLFVPIHFSPLSLGEAICVYFASFIMSCAIVRWFDPIVNHVRDSMRPMKKPARQASIAPAGVPL